MTTKRKAPVESATTLPEGTILKSYVIKKTTTGIPRWMPMQSVELNGFKLFTTDYAKKHIGKSIVLYSREYGSMWPKKNARKEFIKLIFTPSGDAIKEKTKIVGWLKTQKPPIKKGTHFYLDGPVCRIVKGKQCEYLTDRLAVDSSSGKTLSLNLMNNEIFIKV